MVDGRQKWDRDLASLRSHIGDPKVSRLLAYWLSKRSRHGLPYRADIDPTEIPEILPNIFLMDVDRSARRFRIRLAGTAICDAYHRNLTGEDFEDIVGRDAYKRIHSDYCSVAFSRNICHTINNFGFENDIYSYERIVLPLLNEESVVDVLIGVFVTTFKSEDRVLPLSQILDTAESMVAYG